MSEIVLVASPNARYAEALQGAISRATDVVLVTGFASAAGVGWLDSAMRSLFAKPEGRARITIAVDRRGFNASKVFEALLEIKRREKHRLALGIVLEESGLMHAKAVFTRGGAGGSELIVGSANLTQSALDANQELGIHVRDASKTVETAFLSFYNRLPQRSLDGPDAEAFLQALGLMRSVRVATSATAPPGGGGFGKVAAVLRGMPRAQPLAEGAESRVAAWIQRGNLVGKGRRGADALVVRMPLEQLRKEKILATSGDLSLGRAAKESRRVGYSIDLLPSSDAKKLRVELRRVSLLLTKLSLTLPCFGSWMPEAYWEVFSMARTQMLASATLAHENIVHLAEQQRSYLIDHGGLRQSLEQMLERLRKSALIEAPRESEFVRICDTYVREALQRRPVSLIADAVEFRTARQRWTPYDQTEEPYRQLMVDIIQAVFSSTYETGAWPRSSQSFAVRALAGSMSNLLRADGQVSDGVAAQEILDIASSWDGRSRAFEDVVDDFEKLVPAEPEFPLPELSDLLARGEDEGELDEDA